MTETFIKKITVEASRNIKDLEIKLSSDHRQHLILTGKNGSGKTSLLIEIRKYLAHVDNGDIQHYESRLDHIKQNEKYLNDPIYSAQDKSNFEKALERYNQWLSKFGGTKIEFSDSNDILYNKVKEGYFLLAFFDSKRHTNLTVPTGVNKVQLKKKYGLGEKASSNFIQYIVNLKADRSFARDDNENEVVEKIDAWFERLEERLKFVFDEESLKLQFNRKSYNFDIVNASGDAFNFNTLSDGYSAIISIITEILLRMEAHDVKSYDLEGVVIIDEIETHLHVDLQKKILPFLIDFFPKIQFIVTTHSPFVLSSISNVTICDLETRVVTEDLSNYSYDALIESYFKTDKYSEEVKLKIIDFENLLMKSELTLGEKDYLRELRNYFNHSPKYLSNELMVKLQELQLKELTSKKNS